VCCADPTEPGDLLGSWRGSNSTYDLVTLTIAEGGPGLLGTLVLHDATGATVFNGPVVGHFTASDAVLVRGARAPSAGGGDVDVNAQLRLLGLSASITSTWLPATTVTLRRTGS
jgi:hypothetical protein